MTTADERLAALEREVADLRQQLAVARQPEPSGADAIGRRQLLSRLAAGAAGAVGATLALDGLTSPAAAADSAALTIGDEVQTAQTSTQLRFDQAAIPSSNRDVFAVHDTGTDLAGSVLTSGYPAVLGVAASGSPYSYGIRAETAKAPGIAVYGKNTDENGPDGIGVKGESNSLDGGFGVYGLGATGVGAYGGPRGLVAVGGEVGIRAEATNVDAIGVDVVTDAPGSVGGRFQGIAAQLMLPPSGAAAPSRSSGQAGQIVVDALGDAWLCVESGPPAEWRKLAGLTTAGSLHILPVPIRAYDSRGVGPRLGGSTRDVSLAGDIPVGATGVAVNLTVTSTLKTGWLALASGDVAPGDIDHSNANWFAPGQTLPVSCISAVNAERTVRVLAGSSDGGSTHFILDVFGYYR